MGGLGVHAGHAVHVGELCAREGEVLGRRDRRGDLDGLVEAGHAELPRDDGPFGLVQVLDAPLPEEFAHLLFGHERRTLQIADRLELLLEILFDGVELLEIVKRDDRVAGQGDELAVGAGLREQLRALARDLVDEGAELLGQGLARDFVAVCELVQGEDRPVVDIFKAPLHVVDAECVGADLLTVRLDPAVDRLAQRRDVPEQLRADAAGKLLDDRIVLFFLELSLDRGLCFRELGEVPLELSVLSLNFLRAARRFAEENLGLHLEVRDPPGGKPQRGEGVALVALSLLGRQVEHRLPESGLADAGFQLVAEGEHFSELARGDISDGIVSEYFLENRRAGVPVAVDERPVDRPGHLEVFPVDALVVGLLGRAEQGELVLVLGGFCKLIAGLAAVLVQIENETVVRGKLAQRSVDG